MQHSRMDGWMGVTYNNRFYQAFGEAENHFSLQKHLLIISPKINHFLIFALHDVF